MLKIILIFIGFTLGVFSTYGLLSEKVLQEKLEQLIITSDGVRGINGKTGVLRGVVSEINFQEKYFIVDEPDPRQINSVRKTKVSMDSLTEVITTIINYDENNTVYYWETEEDTLNSLQKGMFIFVAYKLTEENTLYAEYVDFWRE